MMEAGRFEVGNMIEFVLKSGEKVQAMAVKQDDDNMIFCHVDCLSKEYRMNRKNTNAGGYEASDLREEMNESILELYPEEIRNQMIPFKNGDLVSIPTEKEIFGVNYYGEDESEETMQWEPMKLRRSRIAFQGNNGNWEWYWLQNAAVVSSASFAYCTSYGNSNYCGASGSYGVRPKFQFKNL